MGSEPQREPSGAQAARSLQAEGGSGEAAVKPGGTKQQREKEQAQDDAKQDTEEVSRSNVAAAALNVLKQKVRAVTSNVDKITTRMSGLDKRCDAMGAGGTG